VIIGFVLQQSQPVLFLIPPKQQYQCKTLRYTSEYFICENIMFPSRDPRLMVLLMHAAVQERRETDHGFLEKLLT